MFPETTHSIKKVVQHLEHFFPAERSALGIRKNLITAAAENMCVDKQERALLDSLFGPEISQLQIPGDKENATNLFYGLYRKVYDNGIARPVATKVVEDMVDEAPAAYILSRAAFLGEALKEIEQGSDMQFALLDLKNIRGADFQTGFEEESAFPHKPADVIVNKFATVLLAVGEKIKGIRVGRYGGDEFVITSQGKNKEAVEAFIDAVKHHIRENDITGIFRTQKDGKTTGVHRKMLEIKKEKGKEYDLIDLPKELDERTIVIDFLKRGLLLTEEQKNRIVHKYSKNGGVDLEKYRVDFPEQQLYPLGTTTLEDKITHITKRYPELGVYFELARLAEDNTQSTQKRANLLHRMENSLFDRLIGEYTYARGEFQHNLEQKRYEQVQIIDLKFVKEMNAKTTYADADMQIRRVWEKIDDALGNERDLVQVSRMGGSYIIGVLKGKSLSYTVQDKLDHLISFDLFGDKETIVPLSNIKVEKQEMEKIHLNSLLQRADDNFYSRLIGDIMKEAMHNEHFINRLKKAHVNDEHVTKPSLYHLFLKGTRREERLYEAKKIFSPENMTIFREKYGINDAIIDQVKEILFFDTV